MKLLIGLALLSVAFATPLVQPVNLPEAPQPALETDNELPMPESPAFEGPYFGEADIRPLLIPQEVLAEIRARQSEPQVPIDQFVEDDAPINADSATVIEHREDMPSYVFSNDVDAVRVVEFSDDDAPINPDAAIVADHLDIGNGEQPISADGVYDVNDAENRFVLPEDGPIYADNVNFVEDVDVQVNDELDNDIVADPIRIVEEPVPIDFNEIFANLFTQYLQQRTQHAIHFVDLPNQPNSVFPDRFYENMKR